MKDEIGPCAIDGCDRPADRRTPMGNLCPAHRKRTLPSRAGGLKLSAPITPRLDPRAKLIEAALAYAQAEEDGDFEVAAEQLVVAAKRYAPAAVEELQRRTHMAWRKSIRLGIARKKAAGVEWRPGPPPVVTPERAREAVTRAGSVRKAAVALGVTRRTVQRALRRAAGNPVTPTASVPALPQSQPHPKESIMEFAWKASFTNERIDFKTKAHIREGVFECMRCGEKVRLTSTVEKSVCELGTDPGAFRESEWQALVREASVEHVAKCPKVQRS